MFIVPQSPKDNPLEQFPRTDAGQVSRSPHASVWLTSGGIDNMRGMNVPFCVNIMAGGNYNRGRLISFTSVSENDHFHIEKSVNIESSENPQIYKEPYKEPYKETYKETLEMHRHDFFELMVVFDGEVEQHIENESFLYTKGTCCLMNRNVCHYEVLGKNFFLVFLCLSKEFISESIDNFAPTGGQSSMIYQFFIDNLNEQAQYQKDYLEFIPNEAKEERIEDCIGDCIKNRIKKFADTDTIFSLLEELVKELKFKRTGFKFMSIGLLSRVLAQLQDPARYGCTHVTLDSSAEVYLFNKITRLMENHEGHMSRAELTEKLNYSGDYINRVVKKHTNMSITEYSQMISIKKAESMLTQTNMSVAGIIASLGFENKTHFYKLFCQKHNMTPLEYRKREQ